MNPDNHIQALSEAYEALDRIFDYKLTQIEKEDLKKGVRLYVTNGEASRFVVVSSEK